MRATVYALPGSHPVRNALLMLEYKGIEAKRRDLVNIVDRPLLREKLIVGVNAFQQTESDQIQVMEVDPSIEADVYDVLSLRGSLNARHTLGGTAPAQVRAQIARHRARLG